LSVSFFTVSGNPIIVNGCAAYEYCNQKLKEEARDSIFKQIDPSWHQIIVNLLQVQKDLISLDGNKKISIIHDFENSGPDER